MALACFTESYGIFKTPAKEAPGRDEYLLELCRAESLLGLCAYAQADHDTARRFFTVIRTRLTDMKRRPDGPLARETGDLLGYASDMIARIDRVTASQAN